MNSSPHRRQIRYDRKFLLSFQFSSAAMNKPVDLPHILDKMNNTLLRPAIEARRMNVCPDFTSSYLGNLESRSVGGPRCSLPEPRCFEQVQRDEPRKSITFNCADVQLNKAEEAWKPAVKKSVRGSGTEEDEDIEQIKTQEMFKLLRSILNKLTPEKFHGLVKQVMDLTIDTEERLKGAVDLIFEKALSEPNFSATYASMCRCLIGLKVPVSEKPRIFVSLHTMLLRRCQKEFEKDLNDDEIFKKKQKEIEAAKEGEERERLRAELQESRDEARRRSLGNVKFIGELFNQKMLAEAIMHDSVMKLLKNHDEESLECLCRLLSTAGKDLDSEKTKPRMNQYFIQIEKIVKERKTSSRIHFMLQDVLDLRKSNWVPRRGDRAPKTIDQIHKEAEMEEQREQAKVQQLLSQKEGGGSRMGGNMEARGSHTPGGGRTSQPQDERRNKVPIFKNRPIDTTRLKNITKPGSLNFNSKLLAPRGKGGKDHNGGPGAKPAIGELYSGRPATSTFNSFSILKQPGSMLSSPSSSDCRAPQKCERVQPESAPFLPPKPALSEEQLEKKSKAIIDEYLHIHDLKEALQCVTKLNSTSMLYVFVRKGVESTLELKAKAREQMGLLLHHLVKEGVLPTEQYYKGLGETLAAAVDIAIDVPHIWLYLAELITPMLHEGGIPMGQLFRQISEPLVPLGLAGLLLVQILKLLCKDMTPKKVGAMWTQGRLNWSDFLSEHEDLDKFINEQNVEYTTGEEMASKEVEKKKVLIGEELSKQLDRLIQNKTNNQLIRDWVEANLDEQQTASNQFVRALMTSVCQSAIICDRPYRVNAGQLMQRASLLQRYLCDEQKQLQALYALQALMVHMEQPAYLLQMFFDVLFDEDVITEEAFYKWKTSKDPAEQTGKVATLNSVALFFTWLHELADSSSSAPAALYCVD